MPHDVNGKLLKVGDKVNVPCTITEIHLTEDYCNLNLETREKMFPAENKSTLTANAKQVELIEDK